ncbi:hypothetical protein AGMMS49579_15600 [Spirochaetia bacterium]|nr:hypothetical protein AGMMS49579_15600 [Spirochaetia bacterium]
MAVMTEEEASALDDLFTRNPPVTNPNVKGVFARERDMLAGLDDFTSHYLIARASATRQTPAAIIAAMVRKEVAAAVSNE